MNNIPRKAIITIIVQGHSTHRTCSQRNLILITFKLDNHLRMKFYCVLNTLKSTLNA